MDAFRAALRGLPLHDSDEDCDVAAVPDLHGGLAAVQDLQAGRRRRLGLGADAAEVAGRGAFAGAERGSFQHMKWVRECKRVRIAEQQQDLMRDNGSHLQHAWNAERLRFGDKVGEPDACDPLHPNAWDPSLVLTSAWKQIGKDKSVRDGIDGERRSLDISACVAGAVAVEQREYIQAELAKLREMEGCPVFVRFYDCTPIRMRFGRLQEDLAPLARYVIRNGDKWSTVTFREFLRRYPNSKVLRAGVLELMAHGISCTYVRPSNQPEMASFRSMSKPMILEKGDSSCLYSACEDAEPQMSVSAFQELSRRVPFAILNEVPDAASGNSRKKAATWEHLPDNFFGVDGTCGAHQGHRIVGGPEKELVGHVHAVHVTCSHFSNSGRLAAAFWKMLDNMEYHMASPSPHWTARNKTIMGFTLLRRREYVASEETDEPVLGRDNANAEAVSKFLSLWNGDWTAPVFQHFCGGPGCCESPEDAKQKMYATAMEVNLLQSKDIDTPSLDDWGSCGQACGRTCAGFLVHDLLAQVFSEALPTWQAMLPPQAAAAHDDDNIERMRIRAQKKAWRAKRFCLNPDDRMRCLILNWLGTAVERMMCSLQHRDSHGNGLLDAVLPGPLNPFEECQQRLYHFIKGGKDGSLAPIFDYVEDFKHNDLLSEIRAMGFDFASQVEWRFQRFKVFPYRLALLVHPLVSESERASRADAFYELRECCRSARFCEKVVKLLPTADAMLRSEPWHRLMTAWAWSHKFTNMWSERLLALFRQAAGGDDLEVERVVANGFLSQMLQQHRKLGRDEPYCTTRGRLVEDGVAIRAAPKSTSKSKPAGGFVVWMKAAEAARKAAGVQMNRAEYMEWQKLKSKEFRELPREEQLAHAQVARVQFLTRQAAPVAELPDPVPTDSSGQRLVTLKSFGRERFPTFPAAVGGFRISNARRGGSRWL